MYKFTFCFLCSSLFFLSLNASSDIKEMEENDGKIFIKFQNFQVSVFKWREKIDSLKARNIKKIKIQLEPYFMEPTRKSEASINNLNVFFITELLKLHNELLELDLSSNYITSESASLLIAESLKDNCIIHTIRLKDMALGYVEGDDDTTTYKTLFQVMPTMKNLRIVDLRGNRFSYREFKKIQKDLDKYNITLIFDENDF